MFTIIHTVFENSVLSLFLLCV